MEVTKIFKRLDLIECLKKYGGRFMTLYRRWWSRPSPSKRNAKRQNGYLRRPYKQLRKEEKLKAKEKGKIYQFECRVPKNCKERKESLPQWSLQRYTGKQQNGKDHLFKKIRATKGNFHAKIDIIKDRNGMNITEAEDIKKRWQEYTEELYRKDLHDHDGVITHLEPDILECEVKWTLGSIIMNKANGGDGIPVELFQILKDDSVQVLHSIHQQIWKTQQ